MAIQTDSGARELILFDGTNQSYVATTGNGNVGPVNNVGAYSQLEIYLELTNLTGTLNVFIDQSSDGGTTWYQYSQLGPPNLAAAPALGVPAIYPASYTLSCGLANANSGSFGDCVRVRYTLAGGSPVVGGFRVRAIGKPS